MAGSELLVIPFIILLLVLLAVTAGGTVLVGSSISLTGSSRLAVSLAVGLSVWIVLVATFGMVFPFRIAVLVPLVGLGTIGSVGAVRDFLQRDQHLNRSVLRADVTLGGLLAIVAIGTYVAWHASTFGGTSEENLFFHSAIAGLIARGDFPPVHPLEPDFQLAYRLGFHLLVAAMQVVTGAHIAFAMGMSVVVSVTLATGLVYALATRYGLDGWLAKLAAGAFFLAGPANWLALPAAARQFSGSLVRGDRYMQALEGVESSVVNGIGVIKQVETNVSLVAGYMPVIAALVVLAPLGRGSGRPSLKAVVLAGVLLGYALSTNEAVYIVVVGGVGLALLPGLRRLGSDLVRWFGACVISVPIGLLAGSLPGTLIMAGRPSPAALQLDLTHLGQLPGIGWLDATATSLYFSSGANLKFPALWNPAVLGEYWWVGVALLVGGGVAFRGDGLARLLALIVTVGVVVPQVVTVTAFPWDGFRFFAAVIPIAGILVGHLVACAWSARGSVIRVGPRRVGALMLLAVAIGSASLASAMWPVKLSKLENPSITAEVKTTQELWQLPPGRLVLVIGGATSFDELKFSEFPVAMSKYVLGWGGQRVPMGHDRYNQPDRYRQDYVEASSKLDLDAIHRLGVDVVYVSPDSLTRQQQSMLNILIDRGVLVRIVSVGSGVGGRALYLVERVT
jgi:hypothetical protein